MISIQTHLNRPDAVEYLKNLAVNHWDLLNSVRKDGTYKANSLTQKTKRILAESETKEYFEIYASSDHAALLRQQNFLQMLIDFDSFYLREIVVSKPDELVLLRSDLMSVLLESDLYTVSGGKLKQTSFGQLLSDRLFSYKAFRSSSACIRLITAIGFGKTTCPYCNYNKLDLVQNCSAGGISNDTTAYLDLDHFFAKVKNPFFAVSFFNLIPSCHSCNSIDKGSKIFSLNTQIHPYIDSFDDYFRFRVSLIALLGDSVDEIFIDSIKPRPLDRTVIDFNLLAKYNNNLEDAKSLINRFIKYKWCIGTSEESNFVELLLGDIPPVQANILRYATAKFKRDLLTQLDVSDALKLK